MNIINLEKPIDEILVIKNQKLNIQKSQDSKMNNSSF